MTPVEVLVAHQRQNNPSAHCLCGFGSDVRDLGKSHPEHLLKMLEEAGYAVVPNCPASLPPRT